MVDCTTCLSVLYFKNLMFISQGPRCSIDYVLCFTIHVIEGRFAVCFKEIYSSLYEGLYDTSLES